MNIWHDMHPDLIRKEEYTVFTANSMGSTAVLAFDGSTGLLQLEHLSDPYVAGAEQHRLSAAHLYRKWYAG